MAAPGKRQARLCMSFTSLIRIIKDRRHKRLPSVLGFVPGSEPSKNRPPTTNIMDTKRSSKSELSQCNPTAFISYTRYSQPVFD